MVIKKKYIQLFLDLNKSDKGLLAFTFSNRFGLSISDVMTFIEEYKKKEFITCDDEFRIQITDLGREAVGELMARGFVEKYVKGSAFYEAVRIHSRIAINEPYIPIIDFYK